MKLVFVAVVGLPFALAAFQSRGLNAAGDGNDQALPTQASGKYVVALRLPADGLYPREEVQIEFRITDSSLVDPLIGATPVIRARTRSEISMPAMPSMARIVETAHLEGVPGEYGVHPTFPHGGEYLLELLIEPAAGEMFKVRFPLQVADIPPLKRKAPVRPWSVELRSSPKTPKAGEPAELLLTIRHKDRPGEAVREFDLQHEQRMHLLIVRSDLGTFSHEHPELAADGTFRARFIFPSKGQYHLFTDVAPKGSGSQVLLSKLRVSGKVGEAYDISKAIPSSEASAGSLRIRLQDPPASALPLRRTVPLDFELVEGESFKPATGFQRYLGALGHLILVHSDGETFVHSHPDELQENAGQSGKIRFLARFPKEGMYRGWIQFQRNGRVETGSLIVRAAGSSPSENSQ